MAIELSDSITIGLILAGGKSSRMGENKALLAAPDAPSQTLLLHMQSLLQATGCVSVLVSGASVGGLPDRVVDAGPLAGIDSALAALPDDGICRQLLIVPVDMPALTPSLLQQLIRTVPDQTRHFDEQVLPLVLPVNQQTRTTLAALLQNDRGRSIHALAQALSARVVIAPPDAAQQFLNLNTPTEWLQWSQRSMTGVA